MADFEKANKVLAKNEGGYVNDSQDPGGETVFGLTRRDWPSWHGWSIVGDYFKNNEHSVAIKKINADTGLKSLAEDVFKVNYWDVIKGDWINDQQIATQCYDCAINQGAGTSAKFMQIAAGVTVDRIIGHGTIDAINKMNPVAFYGKFIALRKDKYEAIIAANPSQEQFRKSWFSRLAPYHS